jgi:hypothetical protein
MEFPEARPPLKTKHENQCISRTQLVRADPVIGSDVGGDLSIDVTVQNIIFVEASNGTH